jgi:hypothetical protein
MFYITFTDSRSGFVGTGGPNDWTPFYDRRTEFPSREAANDYIASMASYTDRCRALVLPARISQLHVG